VPGKILNILEGPLHRASAERWEEVGEHQHTFRPAMLLDRRTPVDWFLVSYAIRQISCRHHLMPPGMLPIALSRVYPAKRSTVETRSCPSVEPRPSPARPSENRFVRLAVNDTMCFWRSNLQRGAARRTDP